jgi:hypothetical protein
MVNTTNRNANAKNDNAENNNAANLPLSPRDRLRDFQRTKPPTFSHSIEVMDVDD